MNKNIVDKVIISVVTMVLIIMVSIIGLSYSYFNTEIVGNDESPSVIITTKPIEASSQNSVAFESMGTDSDTGLPKVRSTSITSEEFLDITDEIDYTSLISDYGNIYGYDSSKRILLARYNLSPTTGLQTTESDYAVPFSGFSDERGYWHDNQTDELKSQYGFGYPSDLYLYDVFDNNIYEIAYQNEPNEEFDNSDYSVAYYVENYISSLGVEATGRLLTYTEAIGLNEIMYVIANEQFYWLGSAYDEYRVIVSQPDGSLEAYSFYDLIDCGVRPVLVVNTSDIQSS